jgi:P-type E1-E2 ATPase
LVFSARHSSPLRAGAKDAIPALFQKVHSISLLSGDNSPNVNFIAKALGDSRIHVFANHTPEMKHDKILELEKTDRVMMVGDGINGALALKKAHIGLAFKGGGASLEFSDIYFLKPDVKLLPQLFFAADRIRKAIFINMAWAVAYNILGITLVLKGVASPILCAIIMPLSSVTVISLSVFRKYFRTKEIQL